MRCDEHRVSGVVTFRERPVCTVQQSVVLQAAILASDETTQAGRVELMKSRTGVFLRGGKVRGETIMKPTHLHASVCFCCCFLYAFYSCISFWDNSDHKNFSPTTVPRHQHNICDTCTECKHE